MIVKVSSIKNCNAWLMTHLNTTWFHYQWLRILVNCIKAMSAHILTVSCNLEIVNQRSEQSETGRTFNVSIQYVPRLCFMHNLYFHLSLLNKLEVIYLSSIIIIPCLHDVLLFFFTSVNFYLFIHIFTIGERVCF